MLGTAESWVMTTRRHISAWTKKQVLTRQMGRCNHCSMELKHIGQLDHIKPLMVGGTDVLSNLQYLCPNCHAHKSYMEIKLRKRCRIKLSSGELYCGWCDTYYSKYFKKHICMNWPKWGDSKKHRTQTVINT